jgi:chromosomal replication initiator protein
MAGNFIDQWPKVVTRLQQRFGLARTHRWLPFVGVDSEEGDAIVLRAPDDRTARTVRKHLRDIQGLYSELLGLKSNVPIRVVVGELEGGKTLRSPAKAGKTTRIPRAGRSSKRESPRDQPKHVMNPQHSLARFAASGNEVALRFCSHVAASPGEEYSPLYFHGPPGVGKTHLIQGVALRFKDAFPKKRFAFCSTESLAQHFGLSSHNNSLDRFRAFYRNVDLLVLDDLQALEKKPAFQIELSHIMDLMSSRGGQMVFAGTVSPRNIPKLQGALKSRILAGVTVELKLPDFEQRLEILQIQQGYLACEFSSEILSYLAQKIPNNTGDLVGAFTKLSAYAQLIDRQVDFASAKKALVEIVGAPDAVASPETIARSVALALNVSLEAILGGNRKPAVVRARQLSMSLTRFLTSTTLVEIGRALGNRSTGCVHFSLKRVRSQLPKDEELRSVAESVARQFVTIDDIWSQL